MNRWILVIVGIVLWSAPAGAQTAEEKAATIQFVRGLQTADGGFSPAASAQRQGSLRATSGSLRALKYFGGEARDKEACIRFVEACFDKSSGTFVDRPGAPAKPDVVTTAIGLMAVIELKMPSDRYTPAAIKFLEENAKTFEEIRMAAAGLESVGARSTRANEWLKQLQSMRESDGTFGKGAGRVRSTGGAVAATLRLGGNVDHRNEVIRTLKDGQRPDGAYGKEGTEVSDLETTYRVLRSLVMLKEKPADVARCRTFVAKCRNSDGGYGVTPKTPSTASATYFAAIILHWLESAEK